MKTRFSIFASMMLALSVSAAAQNSADKVIEAAAQKIVSSKTLTADFRITGGAEGPVTGSIAVAGDKFALKSNINETIYDGATQWTVSRDTEEVSLYEPTDEEIAQLNPFAVIRSWRSRYRCELLTSPPGTKTVSLTPLAKNYNIRQIQLTFSDASSMPQMMVIFLDDNTRLVITITNLHAGGNIPPSTFVVSQKDFPGFEFIDLR